jgi:hypothetical protein
LNRSRISAAVAAATIVVVPGASNAAVGSGYVLDLQLNESAGASTARDSSGMGHHGKIGSRVDMNGSFANFDYHPPSDEEGFGNAPLILVPDAGDGSLDPGSGRFSVTMRFRTKHSFGNILQKGQAATTGGQVKLQMPRGRLSCMFKTPDGTATATSGSKLVNDNVWHVVRCVRTSRSVTMFVDGVQTGMSSNYTGKLNNTWPWSIGGKSSCEGKNVECDYFPGEVDYVRLTKG